MLCGRLLRQKKAETIRLGFATNSSGPLLLSRPQFPRKVAIPSYRKRNVQSKNDKRLAHLPLQQLIPARRDQEADTVPFLAKTR